MVQVLCFYKSIKKIYSGKMSNYLRFCCIKFPLRAKENVTMAGKVILLDNYRFMLYNILRLL